MSEIVEIGKDTVSLTVVDNNVSLNVTTSQISLETASVGPQGIPGAKGDTGAASTVAGPTGPAGPGVATGGTTGQALVKIDGTNYNTQWTTIVSGVSSVDALTGAVDLTGKYLTQTNAASTYEPKITAGTTAQYWRGDKTWQTFPTIPTTTSALTNDSGFITSSALSPYLTSSTASSTYAPIAQTMNLGTTAVAINRASATGLSLSGVSIDGNAGTVTNGVYTSTTSLPNVTSVRGTTIPASATLLTDASTSSALTSFGSNATLTGKLIETISALTGPATNTTLTLDTSAGTTFTVTFGAANISGLLFTNLPSSGSTTITLILKQDGVGSRTITWSGTQVNASAVTPKWAGGTAPTLSTAANSVDIVTLVINRTSGSTDNIYGFLAGKAFA